jgi:hypothetical protein
MGSNLMAHLRSDITARIRRTAIPGLPASDPTLEVAALLVRGATSDGHEYHLQITASAGSGSDDNLFTSVPDLDLLDAIRANQDPAWVPITFRALGQMTGHPTAQPGDTKKSWINLALQNDPATGRPRAWVNLEPSDADMTAWQEMETAAVALASAVAGTLRTFKTSVSTERHWHYPPRAGTLWMGLGLIGHGLVRQVPQPGQRLRRWTGSLPRHRVSQPVPHGNHARSANGRCDRQKSDDCSQPSLQAALYGLPARLADVGRR